MLANKVFPTHVKIVAVTENMIWTGDGFENVLNNKQGDFQNLGKLLLQSARDGEIDKVQELISKGAPFSSDWLGMTALHFAAMNKHFEICDILLHGGINKDAKTKVDRTPVHFAVYEGNYAIVDLLISKNCDINAKDMLKMTPLHWAIEKRHTAVARLLIRNGADVTSVSKFLKTPMLLAIQTGQLDLVEELEDAKERQQQPAQDPLSSLDQTSQSFPSKQDDWQRKNETNVAVRSIMPSENDVNNEIVINPADVPKPRINVFPKANPGPNGFKTFPTYRTLKSLDPKKKIPEKVERMDSDDLTFAEPIVKLDSIDDDSGDLDPSAVELLKSHGISMMQDDDPGDNLIESALQSGRKLVLSEAGKLMLSETRMKHMDELKNFKESTSNRPQTPDSEKNNQLTLRAKNGNFKPAKSVVISLDTFKKMCAPSTSPFKKTQIFKSQGPTPTITKITKLNNSNPIIHRPTPSKTFLTKVQTPTRPQPTAKILSVQRPRNSIHEDEDDLPPNIDVCSDSDIEETLPTNVIKPLMPANNNIPNKTTPSPPFTRINSIQIQLNNNSNNKNYNPSIPKNLPPKKVVGLPELTRLFLDLKKQTDDLKRQFEYSQKQNSEYRARIERLEKELYKQKKHY